MSDLTDEASNAAMMADTPLEGNESEKKRSIADLTKPQLLQLLKKEVRLMSIIMCVDH